MTRNLLPRRRFLHGLGGAVLAAPFLSSVAEREAKAQASTSAAPKRLIVMFSHYGCLTNRWFPAKSHGELTQADYASMNTLKVLEPHAKKLLMVRGVRAMNEWSFQGTYGQTTDPHTQVCGSFFTCQPVRPDDGKFDAKPTGRSLDHVVAEQINPGGKAPLFLQIGGVSGSNTLTMPVISYEDDKGTIFPGEGQPSGVYNKLTQLFGKSQPMNAGTYKVLRGKSVLDLVRHDLESLKRVPMARSDVSKLDAWATLLRETETSMLAQCSQEVAAKLEASGSASRDIDATSKTMINLAVLSAVCDDNRVIFMKFPPNYTFQNLGLSTDAHGLSHRIGNANMGGSCVSGVFDMLAKIDIWYATQFAHLIKQLDSISEGDRTVLDNSATVWFQEMSDGNSHNLNNLPILQAGSAGGYFKQGWAINVEGAKADLTVGHSEEECMNGKTSSNLDAVGTPPDQATQPINKYFVTLMKAVGVKGGPDGYPLKGGSAEVTHYGKYDDTKLFKGGGTTPAKIDKPGEYAELKASGV